MKDSRYAASLMGIYSTDPADLERLARWLFLTRQSVKLLQKQTPALDDTRVQIQVQIDEIKES